MESVAAKGTRLAAQVLLLGGFVIWIVIHSYKTFDSVIEHADKLPRFQLSSRHYWRDFPDIFQKLFEECVGWRDIQVRRFGRFKLNYLDVSPTPRVWLGEDAWLFYNHEAETENYFSLTDPRLVPRRNEWVRALPEWRQWLAARDIRLKIVVAPNKQSTYSEHLPPLDKKREGPTPLDILLQQLREKDPELAIVDLREPIRQAKSEGQIYYKTDTHWNPTGLFYGYRAVAKALGLEALPRSDVRVTSRGMKDGDLPKQMGYWPSGPEPFDHLGIINPRAKSVAMSADANDDTRLDYLDSHLWEQPGSKLPKAVLFHDSFGDGLFGELLAQHFSRLLCIPSNHLDPELIEREKPDVVILEIVERLFQGIGTRRPTDPPRRSLTR